MAKLIRIIKVIFAGKYSLFINLHKTSLHHKMERVLLIEAVDKKFNELLIEFRKNEVG